MSDEKQKSEPQTPDAEPTMETSIRLAPAELQIAASGGTATHQLCSKWENRLAYKIKTTDNEHYRVSSVYGFIEPGSSVPVEITRFAGPSRYDVLLVQLIEVGTEDKDPQAPFKLGRPQMVIRLEMSATDQQTRLALSARLKRRRGLC